MINKIIKTICVFIAYLFLFYVVTYSNRTINTTIFNTPDEASNYIAANNFSKTNTLSYIDNNIKFDNDNNLHPRGFLKINDKLVPFNFLGTSLMFGVLQKILADNSKYINILLIFLIVIYIKKTLDIFYKKNINHHLLAIISILSCSPILYYFNFPYFNIVGTVAFMAPSLYYLLKFNVDKKIKYFFLFTFFMCLTIWFSYFLVLFYVALVIINFFYNKKNYFNKLFKAKNLILIIVIGLVFFVIPLLLVNKSLYDKYLTYGYSFFTKFYFAAERTGNIWKSVVSIIFPSQNLDWNIFYINLKTTFIDTVPFLIVLSVFILRKVKFKIAYIILIMWFLMYNGMGESFMSGDSNISLQKSIIRYWMPIFLILSTTFAFGLKQLFKENYLLAILLLFLSLSTSFKITFTELNRNVNLLLSYENINYNYEKIINKNDYVFSAMSDKHIFKIAKPITWWPSWDGDRFFHPLEVSNLLKQLLENNNKVYAIKSERLDQEKIDDLEKRGIVFEQIENELYKVYLE